MSRSRDLKQHSQQLQEIRNIINAMKNLAFMELHKLEQFIEKQNQVLKNIETVSRDFFSYFPYPDYSVEGTNRICLVIGSERGFCGEFNKALSLLVENESYDELIIVGHKLNAIHQSNNKPLTFINGPNSVEEVPAILNRLIISIGSLQKQHQEIYLSVLHHDFVTNRVNKQQLFPLFREISSLNNRVTESHPPLINLSTEVFLAELIDHYLFAVLHEIFYNSLMMENNFRIRHMDGAIRYLDETTYSLISKANIFRQEEITEEIEVILLTAESEGNRFQL